MGEDFIKIHRKINEGFINQRRRGKWVSQTYESFLNKIRSKERSNKERIRKEKKIEEGNQKKWKMRKDTLLIILFVLDIPFFMGLCNPSNKSDLSDILYDGRPMRER